MVIGDITTLCIRKVKMSKKIQVTYSDEEWEEIKDINKIFRLTDSGIVRLLSLQRAEDIKKTGLGKK